MNTNNNNDIDPFAQRMDDQAAAWLVRLRSDTVSEQDQQQFALWLGANPAHAAAMDTMLELWDDLGVTRHMPVAPPRQVATNHQRAFAALAVAACFVFALFVAPQWVTPEAEPAHYSTQLGERKSIELADGSIITLNTDSRLQVEFLASERRVRLDAGEVFFEVDHDTTRPFVVDVGSAEVRVLGTAFNILRSEETSHITVTHGVVRVTELGNPGSRAPATELLYANQSVAADRNGLRRPTQVETSNVLAWREGNIVADAMPLGQLIAELARYHGARIIVSDTTLAQTTVSGIFPIDEPEVILKALEHSIGVQGVELEDSSILLIKTPL